MSIAILKRKTLNGGNPRNSPLSGNSNLGFSLNGTLRLSSQIGINLGSHFFDSNNNLLNTCSKNNINCMNNNNIKTSVKNTKGLLSSRQINNQNCCKPIQWVQPINSSTNLQNSQSQYIDNISKKCLITDISNIPKNYTCKSICSQETISSTFINKQNKPQPSRNFHIINVSKKPNVAISSGEYLKSKYLKNKCIPIPKILSNALNEKLPFPPNINNNKCSNFYISQIEAAQNGIF